MEHPQIGGTHPTPTRPNLVEGVLGVVSPIPCLAVSGKYLLEDTASILPLQFCLRGLGRS